MGKYTKTFMVSLSESLAYGGRSLVWLLTDLVWIAVLPFVWLTVYNGGGAIAGYGTGMIVTYFFFMAIIARLVNYYNYEYIQEEIKEGNIASFLVKPIQFLVLACLSDTAYKVTQVTITAFIMVVSYPFLKSMIILSALSPYLLWVVPAVLLSMLISALIANIVGMVSFWTTQGEWIKHFWWMLSGFVGGYIAPIAFYPEWIQQALSYTPFPLLVQLPIQVLMQTVSQGEIIRQVSFGIFWAGILFLINIVMWRRGVRRVDAVGL